MKHFTKLHTSFYTTFHSLHSNALQQTHYKKTLLSTDGRHQHHQRRARGPATPGPMLITRPLDLDCWDPWMDRDCAPLSSFGLIPSWGLSLFILSLPSEDGRKMGERQEKDGMYELAVTDKDGRVAFAVKIHDGQRRHCCVSQGDLCTVVMLTV